MGKQQKGRQKQCRSSKGRRKAAAESTADLIASLPRVEMLHDVPTWDDLRVDEEQLTAFEAHRCASERPDEMHMGWVVRLDRGFPLVVTAQGRFRAEHAVSFAKQNKEKDDCLLPAVGDCVAVRLPCGHDMGVIERVLPRRCAFERWRGKNRGERQVLAANVDTIIVVQPLGSSRDTSETIRNRIARSLVLTYDCGATPVVVFTKADRVSPDELQRVRDDVFRLVGKDVRLVVTSSAAGSGLEAVRACIPPASCAMILGESGAGKSTLLNALLGHDALETASVRERDDMGRHTTVARMMVALPGPYGVIADAPGLRSLPLVGHERGLARAFPEVVAASRACRFNDCTHTHEPGCAVREALDSGEIEPVRAEAFLALASEMRVSAQSLDPDVRS